MTALAALKDLYIVSACIGAGYLGISIVLGQVSGGGQHSHHIGHSHGSEGGQGDAAGDAHDGCDAQGDHDTGSHTAVKASHSLVVGQQHRHRSAILGLLMSVLSPSKLAMFMAFFGFSGLILQSALGYLGDLSILAAILLGILGTRWLNQLFNTFARVSHVSSEAKVADMIGRIAEVSVPVNDGRIGEILYVAESKRYNFPARANVTGQSFPRGTQVMISDIRDHIAFIEPWNDIDLGDTGQVLKVQPVSEKQES
jgi:hypothetical protein